MNKSYLFLLAAVLLAACSTPKYTYNFDYYDYNSGRPKKTETAAVTMPPSEAVVVNEPVITASVSETPADLGPASVKKNEGEKSPTLSYKEMSKSERKEFRKEVKKEFKQYVKAAKNGEKISAQGGERLDPDLKMAIIFGAVGLVLALFGGISEVFTVLGVIAILVGVYFLIKWLMRQ